jgi:hypothetical protein
VIELGWTFPSSGFVPLGAREAFMMVITIASAYLKYEVSPNPKPVYYREIILAC